MGHHVTSLKFTNQIHSLKKIIFKTYCKNLSFELKLLCHLIFTMHLIYIQLSFPCTFYQVNLFFILHKPFALSPPPRSCACTCKLHTHKPSTACWSPCSSSCRSLRAIQARPLLPCPSRHARATHCRVHASPARQAAPPAVLTHARSTPHARHAGPATGTAHSKQRKT